MKMTTLRIPLVLSIMALGTASIPVSATAAEAAESEIAQEVELQHTHVFYLQEGAIGDAMKLLRTEAQVKTVAGIGHLSALIVSDSARVLDVCEELLSTEGLLLRSAEPHGPRALRKATAEQQEEPRVFQLEELAPRDVGVIVRSIYRIQQLSVQPESRSISITSSRETLDMIEATLRELDR